MIRIFLGTDSFSKEQHLKTFTSQRGAQMRRFNEGDIFPSVGELNGTALFGPAEVFVFDRSIGKSGLLDDAEGLLAASAEIIIIEDTIPKRGSALLDFSKNKKGEIVNFDPPQASSIASWIAQRAEHHGASITKDGIAELVAALVPEPAAFWDKPTVDLRLLDHELQKLATYTDGKPITGDTVRELTKKNSETEVWHVINAIADKNSKTIFAALEKFLSENDAGADDKAKLILLNALLADQFRNILMVQDYAARSVPEQVILGETGWKSGRLFQIKKLATRFQSAQVKQILQRLADLDIELKTSSTPARPIVDLILAQVL